MRVAPVAGADFEHDLMRSLSRSMGSAGIATYATIANRLRP